MSLKTVAGAGPSTLEEVIATGAGVKKLRYDEGAVGVILALLVLFAGTALSAQDVAPGQIIDRVTCLADPSQSYALFVPADYAPSRPWPVIFAFDPGGRGRTPVERYQAAAREYGYIVVGSNNSRNSSTDISRVLAAMTHDVSSRLAVDPKRVYLAGMSGGARVALGIAMASRNIAGVIASSAGYPDNRVRKALPFPVFATAGTDDFNHLEMRRFDRALTTPHRLVIFNGGHVWLSSELAMQAIEWLELHAMRSGLKARNDDLIDRMLASRIAGAGTADDKDTYLALRAISEDFQGIRDVSAIARRASELERNKSVRAALDRENDDDKREDTMLRTMGSLSDRLATDDRLAVLGQLRQRWSELSAQAKNPVDSPERQLARRVMAALSADGTKDAEYAKIIAEYRLGRGGL
jgi:poly(3-hydroxybutyrate) depolymerase